MALNKKIKTFAIYKIFLKIMLIYLAKKMQIILLFAKKVKISI